MHTVATNPHHRAPRRKSLAQRLGWLLLVPFLLAQLVAQGAMPEFGQDGLRMVLCTGNGPQTFNVSQDGTLTPAPDSHPPQTSMPECPWALISDRALAKNTALPVANRLWTPSQTYRAAHQTLAANPIAHWHPTRAPPATT